MISYVISLLKDKTPLLTNGVFYCFTRLHYNIKGESSTLNERAHNFAQIV